MEILLRSWVGDTTHGITDHYTVESIKGERSFGSSQQSGRAWVFHCLECLANCRLYP
jgi:hypothetical protein